MNDEVAKKLAYELEGALDRFLNDAHKAVVPLGGLPPGMGIGQTKKTGVTYDAVRGAIAVTAVITVEVYTVKAKPPDGTERG